MYKNPLPTFNDCETNNFFLLSNFKRILKRQPSISNHHHNIKFDHKFYEWIKFMASSIGDPYVYFMLFMLCIITIYYIKLFIQKNINFFEVGTNTSRNESVFERLNTLKSSGKFVAFQWKFKLSGFECYIDLEWDFSWKIWWKKGQKRLRLMKGMRNCWLKIKLQSKDTLKALKRKFCSKPTPLIIFRTFKIKKASK